MTDKLILAGAGLGILVLLAAFALPPAINATQTDQTTVLDVEEGNTTVVTDGLEITAENTTDSNATITARNTETNDQETVTVDEGMTETVTLGQETVTVTAEETSSQEVRLSVEYSPTFGWSGGAKTLTAQFDIVLVLVGFVIVVGAIGAVVTS